MDILEKADIVINRNKIIDDLFMSIYSFSTENVKGYIDYFDLKNKSLLTVGSSGDQIINAYNKGCRDLTLIDINPFAKFYINLKIAGISSLSYQEFQIFFFRNIGLYKNNSRYNLELFNKLGNTLISIDYDSYYFFESIFNKYPVDRISNYLMNDDEESYKVIKNINNYLQNEESYNKTKKILGDIYFNYINENIFTFKSNQKYDNIFLSNLCSKISLFELKELIENLKNNNLNKNGSMLFAYIWNTNYNSNEEDYDLYDIYKMPAVRTWLKDYISEHHQITGISDILFSLDKKSDLVLIYKNKK